MRRGAIPSTQRRGTRIAGVAATLPGRSPHDRPSAPHASGRACPARRPRPVGGRGTGRPALAHRHVHRRRPAPVGRAGGRLRGRALRLLFRLRCAGALGPVEGRCALGPHARPRHLLAGGRGRSPALDHRPAPGREVPRRLALRRGCGDLELRLHPEHPGTAVRADAIGSGARPHHLHRRLREAGAAPHRHHDARGRRLAALPAGLHLVRLAHALAGAGRRLAALRGQPLRHRALQGHRRHAAAACRPGGEPRLLGPEPHPEGAPHRPAADLRRRGTRRRAAQRAGGPGGIPAAGHHPLAARRALPGGAERLSAHLGLAAERDGWQPLR